MNRKDPVYIQMFSIHGLLRARNMELGYDADTGGQIKYVVELGRALSRHPRVRKLDLFTRLIADKACSADYSRPQEQINDKFRIIRLQCGGRKYIRKELLWPYLDEFVDRTVKFIQDEKQVPDMVHGHYADGGYIGCELASFFGIPFMYTGHSLGRSKKARLLAEDVSGDEMNRRLKMDHRISVEENIIKRCNMVVTSTHQEIEGQYGLYHNRTLPVYQVIPPGLDLDKFYPYTHEIPSEAGKKEEILFARSSLKRELDRFFQYPEKPIILAVCRPDKRKNIEGLVRAYGESEDLQAMANLAVFAGIRKDISQMGDNERDVLTQMLLLMDKYNLYGRMAIPKKHDFELEIPELYRIVADQKGVFVNAALTEPFGLTLLESLACGLPVVATNDGGPRDIVSNCKSGILVDPKDTGAIAEAVKKLITRTETWNRHSKNGIINTRSIYTWDSHVNAYMDRVQQTIGEKGASQVRVRKPRHSIGRRLSRLQYMLVTDIDNTLLGGDEKTVGRLMAFLVKNRDVIGFGVATGRVFDSALAVLKKHGLPTPDVMITGVGSQINYGQKLHFDKGWASHISRDWKPELMARRLEDIDFIKLQAAQNQTPHKLSFLMAPGKDRLAKVHHVLTKNRLAYTLIYSQNKYLDLLPSRASKGKAVRYVSYKWGIPLKQFLVFGDSGNDEEMLKGETSAVVVGNHSPELDKLKAVKNVYFSRENHAAGILDGIDHYQLFPLAVDRNKTKNE